MISSLEINDCVTSHTRKFDDVLIYQTSHHISHDSLHHLCILVSLLHGFPVVFPHLEGLCETLRTCDIPQVSVVDLAHFPMVFPMVSPMDFIPKKPPAGRCIPVILHWCRASPGQKFWKKK